MWINVYASKPQNALTLIVQYHVDGSLIRRRLAYLEQYANNTVEFTFEQGLSNTDVYPGKDHHPSQLKDPWSLFVRLSIALCACY